MNDTTSSGYSLGGFLSGLGNFGTTVADIYGTVRSAGHKTNSANSDEVNRLLAQQEQAKADALAVAKASPWKLAALIGGGLLVVGGLFLVLRRK